MTWSISKSGPREQVIDELYNSPIPTGMVGGVKEEQHYSRALDLVIATLRASTKTHCSVSASGWVDASGRCNMNIGALSTYDAEPAVEPEK